MGDPPHQYERAVLAGVVVREKLRTTSATAVRGRAYDVVAHQQAAMPEQLLAPLAAEAEHDDQEQEPGRQEAIDMTALRALRKSRTDVEALDLTADRLRRLQEVATKMADDSRVRADRHIAQADADVVRPVHPDDEQAHRPQEPGPHRGREVRPLSGPYGTHPVRWCAPTMPRVHSTEWSPPSGSGRHRRGWGCASPRCVSP